MLAWDPQHLMRLHISELRVVMWKLEVDPFTLRFHALELDGEDHSELAPVLVRYSLLLAIALILISAMPPAPVVTMATTPAKTPRIFSSRASRRGVAVVSRAFARA
jgi:hypothetical protein